MKTMLKDDIPKEWLDRSAQEPGNDTNSTLCSKCERSVRGRCPWREKAEPYPGWVAESRLMDVSGCLQTKRLTTYNVKSCPGFVPTYLEVCIVKTKKSKTGKRLLIRQIKLKKSQLHEDGIANLAEAVMKQAKRDYIVNPHQRRGVEEWVRTSMWFTDPEPVIRMLRDMARVVDLHPEKRQQILQGISDEEVEERKKRAPRFASWTMYNFGTELAFAECSHCGYEHDTAKPFPKRCPGCGSLMRKEVRMADD